MHKYMLTEKISCDIFPLAIKEDDSVARVTMKDVAKDAGVSSMTVSHVINERDSEVSAETISRVKDSIQRLGYIRNEAAKTLGSPRGTGKWRSNLIGVLIPQTEAGKEFMFSNPFYGDFLSAVEYTARANGYHLLISGTNVDQSYTEIAKSRSLDGIIILGMFPTTDLNEYKVSQIPTVLVDCYDSDHYFHSVGINDRLGGYLATQYLTQRGHKRIAFLSGAVEEVGVMQKRLQGYKDALLEAGIPFDEGLIFQGDVGYKYGIEAAQRIAGSCPDITATFATADIIALGALKGFQQAGFKVPQDMSLIGFDDIYMTSICDPALTTVRQDIAEKGKVSTEIIITAAQNPRITKRDVTIPISITERESVCHR
jgi:LacI family transcriptional regulator